MVLAYPSVLENLLKLADGAATRWTCPLTVTSSEVLRPEARRLIAGRLRGDVFDYYGQAERVASAWSIEPDAYFFVPSYGHVELIAQPDTGCREIVGTPYLNRAQILVRYRTGDYIRTQRKDTASVAAIAAGRAPFQGIAGREDDFLVGKGGRILVGIDHIPRGLGDLGRFQIVQ